VWCKKWPNWTSGVGQKNPTPTPSTVRNSTPTPPKNLRLRNPDWKQLVLRIICFTVLQPLLDIVVLIQISLWKILRSNHLALSVVIHLYSSWRNVLTCNNYQILRKFLFQKFFCNKSLKSLSGSIKFAVWENFPSCVNIFCLNLTFIIGDHHSGP